MEFLLHINIDKKINKSMKLCKGRVVEKSMKPNVQFLVRNT